MSGLKQPEWIDVQQRTFTKWLNSKLAVREISINNLVQDLSDGIILIHLLELLGNESLGVYAAKPKLRIQRFENVNLALNYIRSRGIQMTNIGAEDVVDGNRKIILGLIWTLILRFTISDINSEGMTAREGLLLWCQRKTACFDEFVVRDFTTSWNNGLAFCALLDIHRPDLIDYDELDKDDHHGNMKLAFDIAKSIGIPDLLDVEDVCDVARPDEKSIMTYVAYWFHAFSQLEKVENAGRRVEKFVQHMHDGLKMSNSYEERMKRLLAQIQAKRETWESAQFDGTYIDAKAQLQQFSEYKKADKREMVSEKSELATLLGNIKTKMNTYKLRPYQPPKELRLEALDKEWLILSSAERKRTQILNEMIRDIKNSVRRAFADKANDFAMTLTTLNTALSGLDGEIDDQLDHVRRLSDNIKPLEQYLIKIEELEQQCNEANIEENDFTTYTYDELKYELSLVKTAVKQKLAFLENQLVMGETSNLTPIQLEEFESVFRHFDKDGTNTLSHLEFAGALASLGMIYSDEELQVVYSEVANRRGEITFEAFIRFMIAVYKDQNSPEQVFQSFKEVAEGKPYVTELDLRHSLIPDELIERLISSMPEHKGEAVMEGDQGLEKYDYAAFMEGLVNKGGVVNGSELANGKH